MTTSPARSLPDSWVPIQIRELGSWIGGGTPSKRDARFWTNGTIPWVSPKDMKEARLMRTEDRITEEAVRSSAANAVPPGSVLVVVRSGILRHTLPVAVVAVEATINQDLKALVPFAGVDSMFVYYALRCCEREVLHSCVKDGVTVQSVEFPRFLSFEIPLAPHLEQQRIVAAIEKHFTRLDAAVEALGRARANLKRYRASVLKAACEGRLVPTEAGLARVEERRYEPADVLLERILRERRERWEAEQFARLQAAGKRPKDDSWKAKYREPDPTDTDGLPRLPEGWCWTTAERLTTLVTKGSSPGWQGFQYVESGVAFIRSQNVRWGTLDLSELAFLPEEFNHTHPRSIVRDGDVLLNLVGASVGRSAIATPRIDGANTNQAVGILRLVDGGMLAKLLMYFFISPEGQSHISATKADVARANFNLDDIRPTPVPLPPLAEQHRIVAEVERRLSAVDELEGATERGLKRVERLRQSILKDAFEGKLVPQDSNDEPASQLLERMKSERAVSSTASGGGRRRSRRAEAAAAQMRLDEAMPE